MAYIPYGYRIERGKAVIDEEAAEKIRIFITSYLDGASRSSAEKDAGLPVKGQTVMRIMEKGTYLGDGYYPQILGENTVSRAARERRKRYEKLGCFRCRGPEKPAPVRKRFCIRIPDGTDGEIPENPADMIALLYSSIRPDRNGSAVITRSGKEKLIEVMNNEEVSKWQ